MIIIDKTLKEGANFVHALGRLGPSGGENFNRDVFVLNGDATDNDNYNYNTYAEYIVYNSRGHGYIFFCRKYCLYWGDMAKKQPLKYV